MPNLTFGDLENIYTSLKTNARRYVTINPSAIYAYLVDKYNINIDDDQEVDQKAEIMKKIKSFMKKKESLRNHLNHDQRQTEWENIRNDIWIIIPETEQEDDSIDEEEVVDNIVGPGASGDFEPSTREDSHSRPTTDFHLSLLEVGSRQQYRRTAPIISFLKEQAEINKVSVNELIGIVIKQLNYHTDKRTAKLGDEIVKGDFNKQLLSLKKTTYLQQNLYLGRSGYQLLKKTVQCSLDLPSWKKIRQYQNSIMPSIYSDTSITGVRFDYISALQMTIQRILINLPECPASRTLTVKIKDGVDGSGSHSIYQQQGNIDTHNIIMFMFCILEIRTEDQVLFKEELSASPFAMRPLFLILGKKTHLICRM